MTQEEFDALPREQRTPAVCPCHQDTEQDSEFYKTWAFAPTASDFWQVLGIMAFILTMVTLFVALGVTE